MTLDNLDIRNRLLVARLPAMPQILLKLIEQCQAEEVGMAELAKLVAKDPAMTSKILGVANSSAYHRGGRKAGLEQSLAALGTDLIKTLVISESVFQVFTNFSCSNSTDLRAFWKHSLTAAVIAREIAEKIGYPHVEEAYLAGLLHDVGRLALLATAPKEYGKNFLARDDENLCAVEQRTLQITHQEAGAWLVSHWNLDSFLSDSVLYHHESAARLEATHPLIRIILLSHLLSEYGEADQAVSAASALCGIDVSELAQIGAGAADQVRKSAEYLGIDLSGADQLLTADAAEPNRDVSIFNETQKQLAEEVRNLVLSAEAARSFSNNQGESGLIESIARSACLLFDFEDVVIFLTTRSNQKLVGIPVGEHRQRLKELSIPLSSGGVLAEVAMQRQCAYLDSSSAPHGISEEQLLRILGSEALVCLPLSSGNRCLGVMAGGVANWQLPELRLKERFLRSFAGQAADALEKAFGENNEAARKVAVIAEEYREAARKVVHEVNNPLSIIKNYLGVLDSKLERQETVVGEMSILNEEIDRVALIVKGFSDIRPFTRETGTEINRIIRDVVRLFRETEYVPPSIDIAAHTLDAQSEVEGSANALKQILINLIRNAIEAMPNGGQIQIQNSGRVNRDGRLYIELCVKDSGPGIPPDALAKLFSPVATTKGSGHQGLGLSIVHNLVKRSQGLITCRSSNKGTTFEMLFPLCKSAG